MARPVIGITTDHNRTCDRYDAHYSLASYVSAAGGVPLILPFVPELALVPQLVGMLDGLLLSGGNDADPAAWGETRHPQALPIDPVRQQFDQAVLAEAERRNLPVLGICLGMQLMAIHRGGALNQFLPDIVRPDALEHRRLVDQDWQRRHDVTLQAGSRLAGLLGTERVTVNTSHKQAVRHAGNLTIVAHATDGVVEGIEDPSRLMFIGVQWHPERMEEPQQRLLFEGLVKAAAVGG